VAGFRLVVAYDGTEFHGWQRQPGWRTVQGVIEEALKAVLDREVTVQGAGRTDAGVHARGQVASFEAETRLPPRAFPPLLSRHLPADVRIVAAAEAAPGFHARHSATARRYRYRLLDADDLLASRHAWRPPRPAGVEALERSARPLAGRHDFSAFLASGSPPATPLCRVFRAGWSRWEGGVAFDIVADHFLYHMVRTIVGTSLQVAAGEDPAGAMAAIVAARDRRRAGPTAPPQGLALEHVFYPPEEVA
jgi:tRNA pseudouridine38-40 synthase